MQTSLRTYRRDIYPFETDTKGRLFVVDVSINWPSNRNCQTKVLDSWNVTQRIYFFREVLSHPEYVFFEQADHRR